jgi:hypothetical protein
MNPMSSAQSTPDPGRVSSSYFNTLAGSAASATSPPGVNGAPVLPPLHSLPPLQQRAPEPSRPFFDPAYDEQRPAESDADTAGRQRAYSGTQPPPAVAAPQNGDTEMADAGFATVNR